MKKVILLLFTLFLFNGLIAQNKAKRATAKLNWPPQKTQTLPSSFTDIEPFLAFSLSWAGEETEMYIRFSENKTDWEEWKKIGIDPHAENTPEKRVSELLFIDKEKRHYQFLVPLLKRYFPNRTSTIV